MRFVTSVALCFLLVAAYTACSPRGGDPVQSTQPTSEPAASGDFDYYILSLSWAPDFCARPDAQRDSRECGPGRRLGFVVHGLWPQLENGGHPANCAAARPVSHEIVERTLALMPGEGLIQHEWREHGTCSGLSSAAFFDTVRRAAGAITIPPDFQSPERPIESSPREIEAKFAAANPQFRDSFRVACSRGELAELRVCMAKDLSPRPCSEHDTDCRSSRVTVLPVQ